MPLVAASLLDLGHSAPRPWCGGDGFPADPPANGARVGGGRRHSLCGRAGRERTRFRCHAAAVVASTHPPGAPTGEGEVLLFSLRNYRIVASLGLGKLSLVAVRVVVDTGAGPNLVRPSALAPDGLRQVVTSKDEERVRFRDANNARLRTSGTVTLWLQTGARVVPVTFLDVNDLSEPVILGCTFSTTTRTPSCPKTGPFVGRTAPLPQSCGGRWTTATARRVSHACYAPPARHGYRRRRPRSSGCGPCGGAWARFSAPSGCSRRMV